MKFRAHLCRHMAFLQCCTITFSTDQNCELVFNRTRPTFVTEPAVGIVQRHVLNKPGPAAFGLNKQTKNNLRNHWQFNGLITMDFHGNANYNMRVSDIESQ